jgi:hypothetical protein
MQAFSLISNFVSIAALQLKSGIGKSSRFAIATVLVASTLAIAKTSGPDL